MQLCITHPMTHVHDFVLSDLLHAALYHLQTPLLCYLLCRSGSTSLQMIWYVSKVTEFTTNSTTLKPYQPASLRVTMIIPSAVAANALQVSTLSGSQNNTNASTNTPPTAGVPSLAAAVYVACTRRVYQCSNPTVITPAPANFSASSYTTYQETFRCDLPITGLPASTVCEAVVELSSLGFSGFVSGKSNAGIGVGLELVPGSLQPKAGSMAGGQTVTIKGAGLNMGQLSGIGHRHSTCSWQFPCACSCRQGGQQICRLMYTQTTELFSVCVCFIRGLC